MGSKKDQWYFEKTFLFCVFSSWKLNLTLSIEAPLLRPYVSLLFDNRVCRQGHWGTPVDSDIVLGEMDTGETGSTSASGFGLLSRCSSFSLFFPWFWEILMCQAPLELPGLSMSLSQVKSFQKKPSLLPSQGKAFPLVPSWELRPWSRPAWFPWLSQVQGWHWGLWWMSQLAWNGGNHTCTYDFIVSLR